MEHVVVIGEFHKPMCLTFVELLGFSEIFEILMIIPDLKGFCGAD